MQLTPRLAVTPPSSPLASVLSILSIVSGSRRPESRAVSGAMSVAGDLQQNPPPGPALTLAKCLKPEGYEVVLVLLGAGWVSPRLPTGGSEGWPGASVVRPLVRGGERLPFLRGVMKYSASACRGSPASRVGDSVICIISVTGVPCPEKCGRCRWRVPPARTSSRLPLGTRRSKHTLSFATAAVMLARSPAESNRSACLSRVRPHHEARIPNPLGPPPCLTRPARSPCGC